MGGPLKKRILIASLLLLAVILTLPAALQAQGRLVDYERAKGLKDKLQDLAVGVVNRAAWIGKSDHFWYTRTVRAGMEFVYVDAAGLTRKPAFDQAKLAADLGAALGEPVKAEKLPIRFLEYGDDEKTIGFEAGGFKWKLEIATSTLAKLGPAPQRRPWPLDEEPESKEPKASPDDKWEAFIKNDNVYIRPKGQKKPEDLCLSTDGSEGNAYVLGSIVWAPDSRRLAAYRVRPGYKRQVTYVESSPADQLQPKTFAVTYPKPGDALDIQQPVIFDAASRKEIAIDSALFPNAFEMSEFVWRKDSRAVTFEYNQRGHQVYRVIEADAATGAARTLVDEQAKTFFCYSSKKYRFDIDDGKEMVWMSERDGWNHLYLYDGAAGKVKNQITKGEWVVREVDGVDEAARRVYFQASGMDPAEDPYFIHAYSIGLDGTGLTRLTPEPMNHRLFYSRDLKFIVDSYSRVDQAPVTVLRRSSDGKVLMELEEGDITELVKAGWRPPEVFKAKGRDGKTDIWGIIVRPMNFDKSRKYPVIENIYAGPHDSFVPKSFMAYNSMMSLAELGFIVVQIDGMGTSNRSKAFHDVCWKNLADAGFPDRILWHKAVAAEYPAYDTSRVGIYGTSAGGQSAMGALLFHPEFYKVAVASCGCHDNRMDKIWWNEQWMGWPVGPEYAACSNVDNAWRLRGKLLLYVGELDTNVDPSSTLQVVNALIKADKDFELLVLPGENHTSGGVYGERKRYDFFVKNLLGVAPPDWNRMEEKKASAAKGGVSTR
jgi:dipeptidyl aminopeptidase/acylaminoacyl peptidase